MTSSTPHLEMISNSLEKMSLLSASLNWNVLNQGQSVVGHTIVEVALLGTDKWPEANIFKYLDRL